MGNVNLSSILTLWSRRPIGKLVHALFLCVCVSLSFSSFLPLFYFSFFLSLPPLSPSFSPSLSFLPFWSYKRENVCVSSPRMVSSRFRTSWAWRSRIASPAQSKIEKEVSTKHTRNSKHIDFSLHFLRRLALSLFLSFYLSSHLYIYICIHKFIYLFIYLRRMLRPSPHTLLDILGDFGLMSLSHTVYAFVVLILKGGLRKQCSFVTEHR